MSISADDAFDEYIGDGVSKNFVFNSRITANNEVLVLVDHIQQVYGTNFILVGVGNPTCTVSFIFAPLLNQRVSLTRNQAIAQTQAYQTTEAYNPRKIETGFDDQTKVAQMLREQIRRSPKFALGSSTSEMVFPEPGADDTVVGWTGALLRNKTLVTSAGLVIAARSVKDFGAVGNASHDDTQAFTNAFASEMAVFVPAGTYKLTGGLLAPSIDGFCLYGDGWGSQLLMHHASAPVITIPAGMSHHKIESIYLNRDVAATTGGNGINVVNTVSQCHIYDVKVQNQYNGLSLGPTDFSTVKNCVIEKNYNNGVLILNTASDGACQWSLSDVACLQNDNIGFFISSIPGPVSVSLGTYERLTTFANRHNGLAIAANSGVPIHGFRLDGGFLGQDGDHEIGLDTFGDLHFIRNVQVELAGQGPAGRTLQFPASHIGSGIAISANNTDISITNCISTNNAENGYATAATSTEFIGNRAKSNGQAAVINHKNGFYVFGGTALFTGNKSSGNDDGIRSDVDGIIVVANDLRGNLSSAFNQTVAIVTTVNQHNLP